MSTAITLFVILSMAAFALAIIHVRGRRCACGGRLQATLRTKCGVPLRYRCVRCRRGY